MIGILIALQINNVNSLNQQRKAEKEYLLSLRTEFNTNIKEIDEFLSMNNSQISTLENMLELFDNNIRDIVSLILLKKYKTKH
ncbi:hypothetical protein MKD41_03890 [Lutibacter sp. A64]|uniref:hypothetical protein n=1 Tax=Lutibacter sp. A64 TaxID=2918526 RepID=UPI001F051F8F|nr:hypothetical protein MKD41_03890 [Lutibacter sp. A64]